MGYVLGKAEGSHLDWHGHVTAITVAPEYRRLSLARNMMNLLERISDEVYKGFFVDLFVRCSNLVAIKMYEGMDYSVYRRIREYYGGSVGGKDDEDAFGECPFHSFYSRINFSCLLCTLDMRKPLSRDPGRRSVRANGRDMIFDAHGITM